MSPVCPVSPVPFHGDLSLSACLLAEEDHHQQQHWHLTSLLIAFNYRWHFSSSHSRFSAFCSKLFNAANLHFFGLTLSYTLVALVSSSARWLRNFNSDSAVQQCARVVLVCETVLLPPADHKSSSPWRPSFGAGGSRHPSPSSILLPFFSPFSCCLCTSPFCPTRHWQLCSLNDSA